MKRLNENTNLPYRLGDKPTAKDLPKRKGRLFHKYDLRPERIDTDGFFYEDWVPPSRLKAHRLKAKKVLGAARDLFYKGEGIFELNPKTNQKWKRGERCPKRGYFWLYRKQVKKDGFIGMSFIKTRTDYEIRRMREIWRLKKARSAKVGVSYSLSFDHVVEIFPKDYKCPMLGTKMHWSDHSRDPKSPSLDRIEPKLGYIDGNVAWLSNRANTIKNNGTYHEIKSLYHWIRKLV